MELQEAIDYLKKVAKEYKTFGDLDNPEFEDTKKIYTAIEIVLNELDKLQKQNQNLREYLANQGMISDYMRFRNTKK